MVVFWILATLMTALALAFVLVPLLRQRSTPRAAPTSAQVNLEVLRSQRKEIDDDVAAGTLPADARAEALDELMTRAAEDLANADPAPPGPAPRRAWRTAIASALAIPLLAFGLYFALGNPGAATVTSLDAMKANVDDKQIVAMVESLARKVRDKPDDAEGWALLARSMAALGRFAESADAYARLAKLVPNDAQVLADYADVLAMAQGRSLKGRPYELAQEALRIEPRHRKALAIAGTAALDAADYPTAMRYWQTLAEDLPPESDDGKQVQGVLAEIRSRAAQAGKALPEPAKVAAKPAAAPQAKTVTGSVAIAPELAAQLSGTETLFIFARADKGARVPLAVVRATARELPMKFALDDSQAMAPGMNISSASSILVEARISRSGNATPQPGDLVGTSAAVKPGAREVRVLVDRKLP
jgi:cytochrome c-type biogenesis protein CcmH